MQGIVAKQTSILRSRASLLILPLPSDGVILARTLIQLMHLYPCVHREYKERVHKGGLSLGDVMFCRVQKEVAGLGVGSSKTASDVVIIIAHHHGTDPVRLSTLKLAYQCLQPKLFEFMRHRSLRCVALYHYFHLFLDDDGQVNKIAWQLINAYLRTARVTIDVHGDDAFLLDVVE